MHSRIFQISNKPLAADEFIDEFSLIEDATVEACSDYIGDVITSEAGYQEDFQDFVSCFSAFISKVDFPGRKITLVPEEQRRILVKEWLRDSAEKIKSLSEDAKGIDDGLLHYKVTNLTQRYHDVSYLFYSGYSGYVMQSGEFAHELVNLPDEIYVGSIIDYHF